MFEWIWLKTIWSELWKFLDVLSRRERQLGADRAQRNSSQQRRWKFFGISKPWLKDFNVALLWQVIISFGSKAYLSMFTFWISETIATQKHYWKQPVHQVLRTLRWMENLTVAGKQNLSFTVGRTSEIKVLLRCLTKLFNICSASTAKLFRWSRTLIWRNLKKWTSSVKID